MHFGARWLDSYLKHWNQPDTIIMEYNDPQSFDRYAFVRNNPVNRIDPTGQMDTTGNDKEGGCDTPGSPKCILNKVNYSSPDTQWKVDLELYYYKQAYPDYDASTDPYLYGPDVMVVTTIQDSRPGCAAGSFSACLSLAITGVIGSMIAGPTPFTTTVGQPNYPGYNTKDAIGDPDCAGCGYQNPSTLSPDVQRTLELIDNRGPFPYSQGGRVFRNDPVKGVRLLPNKEPGYYTEYTVTAPGATYRGTERIIVGRNGEVYYSPDHY